MEMAEQQAGGVTIVEIKGRIDSNSAKAFGDHLTALISAGRDRVVVDLKNMVYISSAGFRVLLIAGRLAEETKSRLVLCSLSAEAERLFELSSFTDLFVVYATREEGIAGLS
jgi:anti-sigma B factor antagonist